jgi:hypothetical protein
LRQIKLEPFTKVEVHWLDITADPRWLNKEEIAEAKALEIITVGMFLCNQSVNKRQCLKLASDVCDDRSSDVKCIPWGCVAKVYTLRRGIEDKKGY